MICLQSVCQEEIQTIKSNLISLSGLYMYLPTSSNNLRFFAVTASYLLMKVRIVIRPCMTFLLSLLHYDLWVSEIRFMCKILDLFLARHNVRFHNLVDFICRIILLVL